jgi:hypothetical protein
MTILLKLITPIKKLDRFIIESVIDIKSKLFLLSGANVCALCGSKHLHFKHPDAEGWVSDLNGKKTRMLMQWGYNRKVICPLCVIDHIERVFESGDGVSKGDCQFTGKKNVDVISIIWGIGEEKLDLRFGGSWWNGHTASLEAFQQAIRSCTMKTGICYGFGPNPRWSDGKMRFHAQTFESWRKKQNWYV